MKSILSVVLGDYPHTQPLKSGSVSSDRLRLEFVDFKPANRAFKPMVREQRFDASELAIVTFLQAISHGKPLILLPAVMLQRLPHAMIIYNKERGLLRPHDLSNRRVGVRSFTTTTGVWARGILRESYGVELQKVKWITFEEPHVAEYVDATERAPEGANILGMLLDGDLDAVLGETAVDPRFGPVIPDPQNEGQIWYARNGFVPINHMVVVRERLATEKAELVREFYDLLVASAAAASPATTGPGAPTCFGVEAVRPGLEAIIRYAFDERLIPTAFEPEDLFRQWRSIMGEA